MVPMPLACPPVVQLFSLLRSACAAGLLPVWHTPASRLSPPVRPAAASVSPAWTLSHAPSTPNISTDARRRAKQTLHSNAITAKYIPHISTEAKDPGLARTQQFTHPLQCPCAAGHEPLARKRGEAWPARAALCLIMHACACDGCTPPTQKLGSRRTMRESLSCHARGARRGRRRCPHMKSILSATQTPPTARHHTNNRNGQ